MQWILSSLWRWATGHIPSGFSCFLHIHVFVLLESGSRNFLSRTCMHPVLGPSSHRIAIHGIAKSEANFGFVLRSSVFMRVCKKRKHLDAISKTCPDHGSCTRQKTEGDQVVHVQSFDFRYYPMAVHVKTRREKNQARLCMYPYPQATIILPK
jgi:hypothetical protein